MSTLFKRILSRRGRHTDPRPQLVERARSAREHLAHLHERERALGSMARIGRQYAESHGIERCPVHGWGAP